MNRMLDPENATLSKNLKNIKVSGTLAYFPDGCIRLFIKAESKDDIFRVVNIQAHLKDALGKTIRSMPKFQVSTDGRVRDIPADRMNQSVPTWFIRRTDTVTVDIYEDRSALGKKW